MQEDIIIQISNLIREKRKDLGITVQELADRAQVSKGLISQVENSRTVPSLLVLIQIIRALEIDLNLFFKDIGVKKKHSPILIKRKEEYSFFEKEDAVGFRYHRIFTESIKNSTVDIVLLELGPGAKRPMVETEAYEYKYIVSGKVRYLFEDETYVLKAGDSMLFDGRIPHTPELIGKTKATMLVIYFFEGLIS